MMLITPSGTGNGVGMGVGLGVGVAVEVGEGGGVGDEDSDVREGSVVGAVVRVVGTGVSVGEFPGCGLPLQAASKPPTTTTAHRKSKILFISSLRLSISVSFGLFRARIIPLPFWQHNGYAVVQTRQTFLRGRHRRSKAGIHTRVHGPRA
jgi:hypothetical protein